MRLRPFHALPVVLAAAAIAGCGGGGGSDTGSADPAGGSATPPATTQSQATTPTQTTKAPSNAPDGAKVFATAGCEGCHTLKAAGSTGNVGPNLDDLQPSVDQVRTQVANGGGGMPAFSGQLSPAEIDAVSRYVSDNAGS
jgi:mono/diheme cytochrome c family protein